MDKGQFLLYQTPDGDSQIEVKLQNDTVWLSLDQMAELFQRNKSTISRHIKNVLEDGELEEDCSCSGRFRRKQGDEPVYDRTACMECIGGRRPSLPVQKALAHRVFSARLQAPGNAAHSR